MGIQRGAVAPLHHDQTIALDVFIRDIPRVSVSVGLPTNTEALTLAQRIEHEPHVLTYAPSVRGIDVARICRQVAIEEFAKRTLPDKADARRVALVVVRETRATRELAHVTLVKLPERENGAGELILLQSIQEIALILAAVLS